MLERIALVTAPDGGDSSNGEGWGQVGGGGLLQSENPSLNQGMVRL